MLATFSLFSLFSLFFLSEGKRTKRQVAPQLRIEPAQLTIAAPEASVELRCVATGEPPPTVRWALPRPGMSGVSAADKLLLISPLTAAAAGSFRCTAENSAGSSTLLAHVTLKQPSGVFLSGGNVTVAEGGALRVPCSSSSSSSSSSVTWLLRDIDRPVRPSSFRQLLPDGALFFPAISREQAGTYECRQPGQTVPRVVATVAVAVLPKFAKSDAAFALSLNDTAELECRPDRGRVQWNFRNAPIKLAGNTRLWPGNTLQVVGLTARQFGVYECSAGNEAGSATIRYRIWAKPRQGSRPDNYVGLLLAPENSTVQTGSNAMLECVAETIESPVYAWTFVDTGGRSYVLPNNAVDAMYNVLPGGSLLITNVKRTAQGRYTCTARTSHSEASATAYVTVVDPSPLVVSSSPNLQVSQGSSVTLSCPYRFVGTSGNVADSYWRAPRSDRKLPSSQVTASAAKLRLTAADVQQHLGEWRCFVCWLPERCVNTTQRLDVTGPPSLLPPSLSVDTTGKRVLTCPAIGMPKPTVTFEQKGRQIGIGGDRLFVQDGAKLRIVRDGDIIDGITCRSRNEFGLTAKTFSVPPSPTSVNVSSPSVGVASLRWSNPEPPSAFAVSHDVQRRLAGTSDAAWRPVGGATSATSLTVRGLAPNASYEFRVRGGNLLGRGPYAETVTLSEQGIAPGAPRSLNGAILPDSRVQLSWQPPAPPYSDTMRYRLVYSQPAVSSVTFRSELPNTATSTTLSNVNVNKRLELALYAVNALRPQLSSPPANFTVLPNAFNAVPVSPTLVKVAEETPERVLVTWQGVENALGYVVRVRYTDDDIGHQTLPGTNVRQANVSIRANTQSEVSVAGYNDQGTGTFSAPVKVNPTGVSTTGSGWTDDATIILVAVLLGVVLLLLLLWLLLYCCCRHKRRKHYLHREKALQQSKWLNAYDETPETPVNRLSAIERIQRDAAGWKSLEELSAQELQVVPDPAEIRTWNRQHPLYESHPNGAFD